MSTLEIYGVIGWDVTAQDFMRQLGRVEGDITVHLNSGGGFVDEAVAMANRLRRHQGNVTVVVDGLAASAATLVALGADRIEMPKNTQMMVHQPWGMSAGTADELRHYANQLDITEESMVDMYAERTGLAADEVRELLSAETWMSAAEAVERGFADAVTDPAEDASGAREAAALAYAAVAARRTELPKYARPPSWASSASNQPPPRVSAVPGRAIAHTQEPDMAEETTEEGAETTEEGAEIMTLEDAQQRIAELEAQLADTEEEAEEVEAAAATWQQRVVALEDELVRKDLQAAGVPAEAHDDLVELKRANAGLYKKTVARLASDARRTSVQSELGAQGASPQGAGKKTVASILAEAKEAGVESGTGRLPAWAKRNYPERFAEVIEAAGV